MPVAKLTSFRCPECGGYIHVESFIGSKDSPGYTSLYCIGGPEEYENIDEENLPGMDMASFRGRGCGFSATRKYVPSHASSGFENEPGTVLRKDEGYERANVESDSDE